MKLNLSYPQILIAAGLTFAGAVTPSAAAPESPSSRYAAERSACNSGQSTQARQTCLREAGAAYAEARRGSLGDGPAALDGAARERCKILPTPERWECIGRMQGEGRSSGSVAGGGILREMNSPVATTPLITPPPKP